MLFTDTKHFLLHAKGRPAGSWCTRGTVASAGVHVYMVHHTAYDIPWVTGTMSQVSKYLYPKIGHPLPGVHTPESGNAVSLLFKPEGDSLCQQTPKWAQSWQKQQDIAPSHKTAHNMAFTARTVPGGLFRRCPANPTDPSPMEKL